jgi:methionine salvage enolase-phosphatase E1
MRRGMDTEKIWLAKQELNKFLREHPELADVQAMIEENLRRAGNQENRMAVLASFLRESLIELNVALSRLK